MEAWDAIAAGYAAHVAPGEKDLSVEVLRLVGLTAHDTFLDVAAGPGGLGLAAAHWVRGWSRPTGRLGWSRSSRPTSGRPV